MAADSNFPSVVCSHKEAEKSAIEGSSSQSHERLIEEMDEFSHYVTEDALALFDLQDGDKFSPSSHAEESSIFNPMVHESSSTKPSQNIVELSLENPSGSINGPDPQQVDDILTQLTTQTDNVIEAEDISSLLDLFLEYEQSEPQDLFLTPATSPGEVKCTPRKLNVDIMTDTGLTPPDTPPPRTMNFPNTDQSNFKECDKESDIVKMIERDERHLLNLEVVQNEHDYCKSFLNIPKHISQESTNNSRTEHLSTQRKYQEREDSYNYTRQKDVKKQKKEWKFNEKCDYPNTKRRVEDSSRNYCKRRRHSSSSDDEDIKRFRRMVYGACDTNDNSRDASDSSDNESRYDPRKGERNDFVKNTSTENDTSEEHLDKYERLKKHTYKVEKYDKHKEDEPRKADIEMQRKMFFKFGYYKPRDVAKEERRVVYVGGFSDDATKDSIRKRFRKFGPIEDVKLHFREVGDNYGFLTFFESMDAVQAIEYGNKDRKQPPLDLCFGGRREYVGGSYVDFDSNTNHSDILSESSPPCSPSSTDDFDALLKMSLAESKRKKNAQWT